MGKFIKPFKKVPKTKKSRENRALVAPAEELEESSNNSIVEKSDGANENNTNTIKEIEFQNETKQISSYVGHSNDTLSSVVQPIELSLRRTALILVIFYAGAVAGQNYHEIIKYALELLKFVATAWSMCLIIIWKARSRYTNLMKDKEELRQKVVLHKESTITKTRERQNFNVEMSQVDHLPSRSTENSLKYCPGMPKCLDKLYLIDVDKMRRIYPNTELIELDNEFFYGKMLSMIRTPDVDDPSLDDKSFSDQARKVSEYFRGKQRAFEFQYQIKLKKIPPPGHSIYLSCELEDGVKLGSIQRIFVGTALSFVRKLNSGLHVSFEGGDVEGNSPPNLAAVEAGRYEKPHLAFKVEHSLDRLVATKPGGKLPKLGEPIYENPESVKSRKKGGTGDFTGWNCEDTFTLCLWSAYADFLNWKCVNLPGIRPFSFSSVIGNQPINLTLYFLVDDREVSSHQEDDIKHLRCNMRKFLEFEFSNTTAAKGTFAQKWEQQQQLNTAQEQGSPMPLIDTIDDPINDSDDEPEVQDDEEFEQVEELGDGMYLRSGDSILLREAVSETVIDEVEEECYVTNGAGFAVLQRSSSSSTFMLVKPTNNSKSSKTAKNHHFQSSLIRNGDTVLLKMISADGEEKYLSTHRGTWLKWVDLEPKHNGLFNIIAVETEGNLEIEGRSSSFRMRSTYLPIGGKFMLRHKRWSQYVVGVTLAKSAKFGGRLLGLYKPGLISEVHYDEGQDKGKFQQFVMCAVAKGNTISVQDSYIASTISDITSQQDNSYAALKDLRLDSTAWVEMMHRAKRVRQRAYVVRVQHYHNQELLKDGGDIQNFSSSTLPDTDGDFIDKPSDETSKIENDSSFIRLRTVKDLAAIMRLELHVKRASVTSLDSITNNIKNTPAFTNEHSSNSSINALDLATTSNVELSIDVNRTKHRQKFKRSLIVGRKTSFSRKKKGPREGSSPTTPEIVFSDQDIDKVTTTNVVTSANKIVDSSEKKLDFPAQWSPQSEESDSVEDDGDMSYLDEDEHEDSPDEEYDEMSLDEENLVEEKESMLTEESYPTPEASEALPLDPKKKKKKWINRHGMGLVAKGSRTVAKGAAKGAKKSVNVLIPKKLHPAKKSWEPRPRIKASSTTKQGIATHKRKESAPVIAGELSAADQSVRILSKALTEMISLRTRKDSVGFEFRSLVSSTIIPYTELDSSFLRGGAFELGVSVTKYDEEMSIHGSIVARCLWESHWREDWCMICKSFLSFYAPLSKKPSLNIPFDDIITVRLVDTSTNINPLADLPLLVVETFWRCHYLAFANISARDSFIATLKGAVFGCHTLKKEEKKPLAHIWESFVESNESSMEKNIGKWAPLSCNGKLKHRNILNNRKMPFDFDPLKVRFSAYEFSTSEKERTETERKIGVFVEKLLSQALSLSPKHLESSNQQVIKFLDSVGQLRFIPLHSLKLSGKEAYCVFINIFHCLLQHALLVTLPIHGALSKKKSSQFMRCSCYEIGGDVFSLAELESKVLRGKMSRPFHLKAPYIQPPQNSSSYLDYALDYIDPRLNFVLNNGTFANLPSVPVYTPEHLEIQTAHMCRALLKSQLEVDTKKQIVTLPKICEIHRNDFGRGDPMSCLLFCVQFVDEQSQTTIIEMINSAPGIPFIMYHHTCSDYFTCLKEEVVVPMPTQF